MSAPRKRQFRVLMDGPQGAERDARNYRRALSAIANASAGDYLPGEDALSYWQRFARELQRDARRALNGEG